jgi:hypothetical protein
MSEYYPVLLQAQLGFCVVATIVSAAGIIHILHSIERSQVARQISRAVDGEESEHYHVENDLELETSDDTEENESTKETKKPKRRIAAVPEWTTLILPTATTSVLVLMVYLLLVYLPSGLWLSILGVIAVMGITLRMQLAEELRRKRLDRLFGIITLFLVIAAMLSIATYCRLTLREGEIYQGRARIVGYDETSYNNGDGDTTRTDLEVSWGSSWGCPHDNGKECQAFVNGALCEAEGEDRSRTLRILEDQAAADANDTADEDDDTYISATQDLAEDDATNVETDDQAADTTSSEAEKQADTNENDAKDAQDVEEVDEENEELDEELDEEVEENEELEEENEELDVSGRGNVVLSFV